MVKDNNSGLYLVSVVAIVAVVALFLMVKGGSQTSSEEVMVVDEEGNLVGEAFMGSFKGLADIEDVKKVTEVKLGVNKKLDTKATEEPSVDTKQFTDEINLKPENMERTFNFNEFGNPEDCFCLVDESYLSWDEENEEARCETGSGTLIRITNPDISFSMKIPCHETLHCRTWYLGFNEYGEEYEEYSNVNYVCSDTNSLEEGNEGELVPSN
mgnify:CR=1 FL=1